MGFRLEFTMSESQARNFPDWDSRELTIDDLDELQLTYESLRSGDGRIVAILRNGLWIAERDGREYSDVAIAAVDPTRCATCERPFTDPYTGGRSSVAGPPLCESCYGRELLDPATDSQRIDPDVTLRRAVLLESLQIAPDEPRPVTSFIDTFSDHSEDRVRFILCELEGLGLLEIDEDGCVRLTPRALAIEKTLAIGEALQAQLPDPNY